jgi:hypothetical protein
MDVKEIFEQALKDPSLTSNLDIEKLIESLEDERNDYLENKTMQEINHDIFNKIKKLNTSLDDKKEICEKLIGYHAINEVYELHKGKHIRWIRNNKLTNGGIIVDVKFTNNGTQVLCMNSAKRFIQIKIDECMIFQKLSETEQLIIMAYECVQKNEV